jgi:predicted Zn-dependent protease
MPDMSIGLAEGKSGLVKIEDKSHSKNGKHTTKMYSKNEDAPTWKQALYDELKKHYSRNDKHLASVLLQQLAENHPEIMGKIEEVFKNPMAEEVEEDDEDSHKMPDLFDEEH